MSSVIEIEVSGTNRNLHFEPLDKTIRGELDFAKIKEPQARMQADRWPLPIPGQKIRLDVKAGQGSIIDPLHDELHRATREQIEKRFKLPPACEVFEGVHVPSWIDRMQRAVRAGHAKLTQGQFPDKLPGKPIQSFLTGDQETPADRQMQVLDRLAAALDKLADRLNWGEDQ